MIRPMKPTINPPVSPPGPGFASGPQTPRKLPAASAQKSPVQNQITTPALSGARDEPGGLPRPM